MLFINAEQRQVSSRCFPSLCIGKTCCETTEISPVFWGVQEPVNSRILQSIAPGSVPNPCPHTSPLLGTGRQDRRTFALALCSLSDSLSLPHMRMFGVGL